MEIMTEIVEMTFTLICKEDCDGMKPYWANDIPVSSKFDKRYNSGFQINMLRFF